MANLYRKPIVITDPKTGKRVKTYAKKWWGRYRDENGVDRRVPLATDKGAALTLLNEHVKKAERRAAGLEDPFEKHNKRPLKDHIADWEKYLLNKGNTQKHVGEVVFKAKRILDGCSWKLIRDISANEAVECLAQLRENGLSIQTTNHHIRAIKQFSRWLVRDRRTGDDRLAHLAMQNPKVDRRHDRRPLTPDEFRRLVHAAKSGPPVESIDGPDRAMMYVLAAWTGFRKGEIGSLTRESFRLEAHPSTATVAAAYSKRRREDTQILHPDVARQLIDWLADKPDDPETLLFPVSGKVPGGTERKTNLMMYKDLERARAAWIEEASADPAETKRRQDSDFLTYADGDGKYADFHSNRHLFITSLERAGLSPKMAQTLARHSDIRLTLGLYTHVGVHDQTAAIQSLPAPPGQSGGFPNEAVALAATGTEGPDHPRTPTENGQRVVPTVVPRGAKIGAIRLASDAYDSAPDCTEGHAHADTNVDARVVEIPKETRRNRTPRGELASPCTDQTVGRKSLHPSGFEPLTFGSVDLGAV